MTSKSLQCRFLISAVEMRQFPNVNLSEFAFVGRSNVGKSSLINTFVGSEVCRVSKTPGRTQQINFFETGLSSKHFIIADLPGYGYAAVSQQMRSDWNRLISDYLQNRKNLKRIFLLIDSRHGIKKNDEEIMLLLDRICLQYQLIITKVDKIKSRQEKVDYENTLVATLASLNRHPAAFPQILQTSAETRFGMTDLFKTISSVISD